VKAYLSLCHKEWLEILRTYRLWIMLAVFVIIGLMNPMAAKFTPALLEGIGSSGGIVFEVPEPMALDSWAQFFSNTVQLGTIALIIVFMGLIANEFSRGTLVNILTKGVPRASIILAKLTVAIAVWTGSYLVCLGVTWGYTVYFWDPITLPHALLAFGAIWLWGVYLIALIGLGGVWLGSTTGALLTSVVGGIIVPLVVSIIPQTGRFNPISLAGGPYALLTGQGLPSDFIPAVLVTAGITLAAVIGSILVFNRKTI
jgi:ABC-2 type transport system permease protein